jgi:tagatose-1,6-bisphosphate aldolase non-catalytic subunit AgaZ/GatZ
MIIPDELINQYLPEIYRELDNNGELVALDKIIQTKVLQVLDDYFQACT